MGSTNNLVLIPNHSTVYEIMNEFVIPKSKIILHHNFNKLEALFLLAFISTTNPPWKKIYTFKNVETYLRWLGIIFHRVPMIITIEHLTFENSHFAFLENFHNFCWLLALMLRLEIPRIFSIHGAS
jgi:hypothetical protein